MIFEVFKDLEIKVYVWFGVLFSSIIYQLYHNWNSTTGEKFTDPWNYGYTLFIIIMYIVAKSGGYFDKIWC